MNKKFLDAKDLKCPMPIIEISKAVKQIDVGETIEIHATDPVFRPDLEAWCRKTGNEIITFEEKEGFVSATIEKKSA